MLQYVFLYGCEVRGIVRAGLILKGRYCVLEQVGAGGEGCVFLARDLELGSVWAVKELPLENKKEAKLMRLLEHPVLPRMVDYVERGEFCYLIMEFIRGKTVRTCLQEGQVFSLEQILNFGIEVADVLEYLHGQDPPVFYGDLKPENLMLSEHGKLYLIDLGSASKMYDGRIGQVKGTYGYAAPEQYDGQVKKSSDVYALGKTLWELMGKRQMLYALRKPQFLIFLLRCCQSRADWRYSDMGTVREKLRKLQSGGHSMRTLFFLPFLLTAILTVWVVGSHYGNVKKTPFAEAMDQVTGQYYQPEFLEIKEADHDTDTETDRFRKEICKNAEGQMQKLLKTYSEEEEQKKLLLLLARNAELGSSREHAALYYEQLLLYEPEYREGYGAYGCFLFRIGQREEGMRLWNAYQEKEQEGIFETPADPQSKTLEWWERKVREYEKEMEGKQAGVRSN